MPLLLLLLLVLFVAGSHGDRIGGTYNPSMCQLQPHPCGNVIIKYPFYLSNKTENNFYCGYPGLAISCVEDDGGYKPIMQSDDSYTYTVLDINHSNLTVSLADTDMLKDDGGGCPKVRHNVTIPSTLWLSSSTVVYLLFFVNCSFEPLSSIRKPPKLDPITCPGFDDAPRLSFVLPQDGVPPGPWSQACPEIYKVPVPKFYIPPDPEDPGWRKDGFGKALRGGFQMNWSSGTDQCKQCEQSKGQCAHNNTGKFLGCVCSNGQVDTKDCSTISPSTSPSPSAGSKKSKEIIIGVSVGVSLLLVVAGVLIFFLRKRRLKTASSSELLKYSISDGTPRSRGSDMGSSYIHDLQTHLFTYEELEKATEGFSETRELGDGGFGTVYKGNLRDGRVVAVKRLYNNNYRRVEQFVNEAAILSRLRHPNLVMFYGCTSSHSSELLLVYEFIPNGTVADHLHGPRAPERALTWPVRLNIAIESAAALSYLHAISPPIVHRDVKTTNILLDADFHVKVADFGLSRLFPFDVTHVSTAPQGTPGYVDPEYHQCYQLTDKSDVYSFGVVLVELISSKPAVDITRKRNEINLAGMAINKIQKCQLDQLVDLELGYESDPATKKMITMVAELAFRCLQQNGEMRPPIKEVLEALRGIQDGCRIEKNGERDLVAPFSPDTVHAPWDSRSTTPNTSQ